MKRLLPIAVLLTFFCIVCVHGEIFKPVKLEIIENSGESNDSSFAHKSITSWQLMTGGSKMEHVRSIQQTVDAGYIIAGNSTSDDMTDLMNNGSNDCLIIKLDSWGKITWQKMIGGNADDSASSIQQTPDWGYIVAGSSHSTDIQDARNNGDSDCLIFRLDSLGNTVWRRMIGGSAGDWTYSIQQTSDGGYIAAGSSESTDIPGTQANGRSDCYIIKLDGIGNIVWQKLIGGTGNDEAKAILQTKDGGYIVLEYSLPEKYIGTGDSSGIESIIIKLDALGNTEWQKTIGDPGAKHEIESIQQTLDGGFIAAGYSFSKNISGLANNGVADCYIVRMDRTGATVWERLIGGSQLDTAHSIQQTIDGGFIVLGESSSVDIPGAKNNGLIDYHLIKLDALGNTEWQRLYGGSGGDWAEAILQTRDGGYICAGASQSTDIPGLNNSGKSDCYIIKLDASGNL